MPSVRRIHRRQDDKRASPGAGRRREIEVALSRLAARQHGVVATWQLLELGFTRQQILLRVRQGRLHRLHHGVFLVGHPAVTREGRWMGAVLAAGRPAVLSHRDGAALWELPDFTSPHVEVTLPELGGRAQPGIRVHRTRRLPPEERTILRGVPVTTVERLMVDLAAVITPRHLRDVLVEAERKRLVDHRMMRRTLEGSAGRRGIRVLRRMVDQLTPAFAETRSPFEVDFLEFCRKQTLPEPQVNVWVSGYLVDAYWPDANLVGELDSYEFHRDRRAFERDRAEIADLKLAGIDAIPITYRRLSTEPTKVASVIRHELAKPRTPTP